MKLNFTTQEMSEDQIMDAVSHYQKFGWLGFVDSEDATDLEIPEGNPTREGKSQSKRLYGALYVLYMKKYPEGKDFDNWRHQYMEGILDKVKAKIEEYE